MLKIVVTVLVVGCVFAGLVFVGERSGRAEQASTEKEVVSVESVKHGIRSLQPWYYMSKNPRVQLRRERQFFTLAGYIHVAALRNEIDPRLGVVVGFRESSLLPTIESRRGSRGERGYFQVMPGGLAVRVCGNGCNQKKVECNISTAMCFLKYCRDLCGESPWEYIGGYGRSRCPDSIEEAQGWPEVVRARKLLCDVYGDWVCRDVWPSTSLDSVMQPML